MKNSLYIQLAALFAFLFFVKNAGAQSEYFCHTPAGVQTLNVSSDLMFLQFKQGGSADHLSLLQSVEGLESLGFSNVEYWKGNAFVQLPDAAQGQQIEAWKTELRQHESVAFAHPFFEFENGRMATYGSEIFVGLWNAGDVGLLEQMADEYQLEILGQHAMYPKRWRVKVTPQTEYDALEMANLLAESGQFAFAEVDFFFTNPLSKTPALLTPNDPNFSDQWHLENPGQASGGYFFSATADADIDATDAWNTTTGEAFVKIAILDDGVDTSNPDLMGNLLPGYDATGAGPTSTMNSEDGHGTTVAEVAAAVGNNNDGGAGVAYSCSIVPVKIFESIPVFGGVQIVSRNSWVADGIDWAWNNGHADVLNNSWAAPLNSSIINTAINNAVQNGRNGLGSVVLFSSGNENTNVSYPATLGNVIAVGATSPCDEKKDVNSCDVPPGVNISWGSNFGTGLDVAAPGVHITASTGASFVNDGTSMSCPMVAGIVALIFSKNPALTGSQARSHLESTCEKVGGYSYVTNPAQPNGTWCPELGYGRVNANLALNAVPSPGGNDVGVVAVLSPESNCGLSSMEQVDVTVMNFGNNNAVNVPLEYRFRVFPNPWGAWTSAGTLASVNSLSTALFSFNINASATGDYTLEVRTALTGDTDNQNDQSSFQFTHHLTVSALPYSENFEATNGGWHPSEANNLWVWGNPISSLKTHIETAGEGSKCWVTNPGGPINPFMDAYLYSPCFDFSALTSDPMISFLLIYHFKEAIMGNPTDYGRLEASTDGGNTWTTVGSMGGGTNWYNATDSWADISPGGTNNWIQATHLLTGLAGQPDVRLRFLAHTEPGTENTFDGMAIDKIEIFAPQNLDAAATAVLSPKTNCGMTNMENVEVSIQNRGNTTLTNVPIQYRFAINGAALPPNWQSPGSFSGNIAPGQTAPFFFFEDFTQTGDYVLEVRTQLPGDSNAGNDVVSYAFTHYAPLSTFPANESFEGGPSFWTTGGTRSSWQLGSPFATVINSASDGANAWVTNMHGNNNPMEASYVESPCFDFSALTSPQIKLDIWHEAEQNWDGANVEYSTDGGNTWTVVGANGDPNNWYNGATIPSLGNNDGWTGHGTAGSMGWLSATHALTGLNGQSEVRFRINFGNALNNSTEGFAFDNVTISNANSADVGIQSIDQPAPLNCSMSANESVQVTIKNFGATSVSNINVEYKYDLNGQGASAWQFAGTLPGPIAAGQTATFNFAVDFSQQGDYEFDVRTVYLPDQNPANDSLRKTVQHVPSSLSTFPSCEDFEMGPGDWLPDGLNSSWVHGVPNATKIDTAASGTKAYVTNLTGNYGNNETSILLSPCIDASSLNFAKITFDLWYESQSGMDGLKLQYTIDGGENWTTEMVQVNGYNNSNISSLSGYDDASGWTGSTGKWVNAQAFFSPLGSSEVFVRFVFASDGTTVDEGAAIDNICIYSVDENNIALSNGCSAYFVREVNGSNQVHIINSTGDLVGYLMPNGNDLGLVTLQMNDMANVPQAANSVYYLPRYFNFTCSGGADCPSSGNFPQGNVTVGFYLQTPELNDYNTQGGSSYSFAQLNATHFDGGNENCTLNDNSSGTYSLISNASMFGQNYNSGAGYVVEFEVSKFSEFGFHGTNQVLQPPPILPVELIDFQGFVLGKNNHLTWSTASERNVEWHIVERSLDGRSWSEIGRLPGQYFSDKKLDYAFEDMRPPVFAYYRLRSVDFDGQVSFSKNISLRRPANAGEELEVFPNPAHDHIQVQFESGQAGLATLFLKTTNGHVLREINVETAEGRNQFSVEITGLPAGVYFIEMKSGSVCMVSERVAKF